MSRPHNLEKIAAREEKARLKEEEYRLRRIRESKAFHNAQGKEHQKRLIALGQLVESVLPDKSVKEIANLLNTITWGNAAQQAEEGSYLGAETTAYALAENFHRKTRGRLKEPTFKDHSDTIIPAEARDDAVKVVE